MADEATLKFILEDSTETPAPGSVSSETLPGTTRPAASPGAAAQAAPTPPPVEIAQDSLDPLLGGLYNVQVAVAGLDVDPIPAPQPQTSTEPASPAPQPSAGGTPEPQAPILPEGAAVAVGGFGVAPVAPAGTPAQPQTQAGGGQGGGGRPPTPAAGVAAGLRTGGAIAGQLAQGQTLPAIGTAGGAAVTALEGLGAAGLVAGGALAAVGIAAAGAVAGVQAARSALEAMAADVAGFSAELANAQAQREVLRVQRQIERGGTVGSELSEFVRAQAKLEAAVGRATDQIIEVLAPLLTTGLELTGELVEASKPAVRLATEALVLTQPLLQVLKLLREWLPNNDDTQAKGVDIFDMFLNLPDLQIPGFDPANGVRLDNVQLDLDLPEGAVLP